MNACRVYSNQICTWKCSILNTNLRYYNCTLQVGWPFVAWYDTISSGIMSLPVPIYILWHLCLGKEVMWLIELHHILTLLPNFLSYILPLPIISTRSVPCYVCAKCIARKKPSLGMYMYGDNGIHAHAHVYVKAAYSRCVWWSLCGVYSAYYPLFNTSYTVRSPLVKTLSSSWAFMLKQEPPSAIWIMSSFTSFMWVSWQQSCDQLF